MGYGGGAAGAAAVAAAVANAIKASGAIIKMRPEEFQKIINRAEKPVVAMAESSFFGKSYKYITGYGGLFFYTKSNQPLMLPGRAELIVCDRIWIPG